MATPVTDPALLQQLNGGQAAPSVGPRPVTDPAVLAQLNGAGAAPQGQDPLLLPSQGLSGINEGIAGTLGFPVDAANMALRAGAAGLHAVGGPNIQLPVDTWGGSQSIKNMMGGAITAPASDPGSQIVRRVGQEVGAAAVPIMGAAAASSRPLATAALQIGSTRASGTGAAVANQVAPNNRYADLAGEILGGGLFTAGTKGLQKLVTPFPISPDRAAMNNVMRREGVDLTAGQQTGSKGLQYAESELGGGTAQAMTERQQQQFTQAALSKAGISAQRATPEVMDQAFTDIGRTFDDLAAANSITPDKQLGADIRRAYTDYHNLAGSDAKPIIGNSIQDLANWAGNGVITGDQYKALRSRLSAASRNTANPELKGAIRDLQFAVDGAMERSIAQSNPTDLGAWQQARTDYRNMLVIEKAAGGAGEAAAGGLISPAKLRQAVVNQGLRQYVRGQGDFADLTRAGVGTMSPLPQSGTAPRLAVRALGTGIPSIIGAMSGSGGGPAGMALGGLAGSVVPHLVGKAMLSAPGRAYFTNQWWKSPIGVGQSMMGPLAAGLVQQTQQAGQ